MARLTDKGWEVLVKAAPGHVETGAASSSTGYSADEVAALEKIAGHVVQQIEAARLDSTR